MDPETEPVAAPARRALPVEVVAGALLARADTVPATFDESRLEVDVVMGSGVAVVRVPWFEDPYIEELSMDPAHVRMDRLGSGRAPLLNQHARFDLEDQIGRVVSARVEDGRLIGRVQFSDRPEIGWIVRDVRRGIISNLSIGYRVHRFQETTLPTDTMRRLRAVDWEPFECSLVTIPADPTSEVRSQSPRNNTAPDPAMVGRGAGVWTTCQIEGQTAKPISMTPEEQARLDAERAAAAAANPTTTTPAGGATAVAAPPAPANDGGAVDRALANERARCAEAARLGHTHGLGAEWVARMVNDTTRDLAAIQRDALATLAARTNATAGTSHVAVGEDSHDKARRGIAHALEVRMGVESAYNADSEPFRRRNLMRLAEEYFASRGIRTNHLSVSEMCDLALKGRTGTPNDPTRGLASTSDFASLLSDAQGKAMRRRYLATPQTWLAFARRTENPDFKPVKRIQLSNGSSLARVNEGGEVTRGRITDEAETYRLYTEGLIFGFTRTAFVNDDMGELNRMTERMGVQAANRRSDLVYSLLTGNVTMADGQAWFSAAHSNNATGAPSALQESSLNTAVIALGTRKDKDGNLITVRPKTLLVPYALWVTARKLVAQITPNASSSVNPFAGEFEVVREGRLDAQLNGTTTWYLMGDPNEIDVVEYAELAGQNGPVTSMRNGWDVDGVEFRILDDFGAAPLEHVSAYRAVGA